MPMIKRDNIGTYFMHKNTVVQYCRVYTGMPESADEGQRSLLKALYLHAFCPSDITCTTFLKYCFHNLH